MLSILTGPLAAAVDAALAAAPPGPIAVLGNATLARRLKERGRDAVLVDLAGGEKQLAAGALAGALAALPFADGSLAALIAAQKADPGAAWDAALAEWRRAVVDGGLVVFLDRGEPTEPARRALCAGLTEVGQRGSGRTILTTARVVRP